MLKVVRADIKKSDITVEEAEHAEMYSVPDASEVYDDFKQCPALVIPYVDPWTDEFILFERDGEQLPFRRVRYFFEEPKNRGFGKQKKQLRYSQPKDSGVHAYFPVVEDTDWVKIAKDTNIAIMITEGEKKSLRATIAGMPTIGLGGVYNFTHDGELLPILDNIDWNGRTVYICYDSDAAENNKIQVAEGRLATELSMKRNASVFLIRIPAKKGGAKIGVDDLIAQEGRDALLELVAKAPELRGIDREVLKMNAEAAYIERESMILDLTTDTWIKKAEFTKGSHFSTRKIEKIAPNGKGSKIMSVADAWLTHEHARRYTDTVFRPGTVSKAVNLGSGGTAYNRFRGLNEVECTRDDIQPFFDLYDWLLSRTDEFDHDMLWKILAYKVQNWEENIGLGLVLLGSQGGGKSLFCDILGRMVAPYNKVMSTTEIGSDFNGWIETSLIVVMNEAKSVLLKDSMERLRTYVTDELQPMNEKYRPNRQVSSYAFYIFNSNDRSAGAFSNDDRRMIVVDCPGAHPDGDDFYGPIYKWLKEGGAKKLMYWLMHYDLGDFKPPRHAPETREKRMAYHSSLTPIQELGDKIINSDENLVGLWIEAAQNWASTRKSNEAKGYEASLANDISQSTAQIQVRPFYTPDELAMMFPAIAGTLSLARVGSITPSNMLAQQLRQLGVRYLKCEDNYDGFVHKGQIRQFLVIADRDEYDDPITQAEFVKLMKEFPTYNQWRAAKKKGVQRAAKRQKK